MFTHSVLLWSPWSRTGDHVHSLSVAVVCGHRGQGLVGVCPSVVHKCLALCPVLSNITCGYEMPWNGIIFGWIRSYSGFRQGTMASIRLNAAHHSHVDEPAFCKFSWNSSITNCRFSNGSQLTTNCMRWKHDGRSVRVYTCLPCGIRTCATTDLHAESYPGWTTRNLKGCCDVMLTNCCYAHCQCE